MREIKFRAWYEKGGYMLPVETIDFKHKLINEGGVWGWFHEVVLMQFTGLKDKNDVEIYEGDIVEAYFWNDKLKSVKEKGFIELQSGSFIFNFGDETWEYLDGNDNVFVIGNIYENKNLLEE